jgi:endoglucanase
MPRPVSSARLSDNVQSRLTSPVTRLMSQGRRLLPAAACATLLLLVPAAARAGTANAGLSGASASDPIGGMTWGYYTGNDDEIWPTYQAAVGKDRQLLAEVAMRPEANWFGNWETAAEIKGTVAGYIHDVTHGNAKVLAQLTDFSLSPWEGSLCKTAETAALVSNYHQWNDGFAAGIGNSRTLVVMQPDLPEADDSCLSSQARTVYLQEVAWATQKLDALTHTTVYLDAGSSDWSTVPQVTSLLVRAGIKWARGFSLDATHFASTQSEITYGKQVATALSRLGYNNKHFIIDTAENGSPFTYQQYRAAGAPGNVPGCQTPGAPRVCQTFGIPPTWQVALPQWKLGGSYDALAAKYVDGYVWFGRPWLYGQAYPFDCELVEQMAQSTPFPYPDGASQAQQTADTSRRSGANTARARAAAALPANTYCPASSLGHG